MADTVLFTNQHDLISGWEAFPATTSGLESFLDVPRYHRTQL